MFTRNTWQACLWVAYLNPLRARIFPTLLQMSKQQPQRIMQSSINPHEIGSRTPSPADTKSEDAQTYIKWHSSVGIPYPRVPHPQIPRANLI